MQGLDFLLKNIYIPVWMYSVWGTHPSVVSAAAPAPTPFVPSAPSAPALSAGSDFEALRVVVDDLRARVAALEVQLQETKETHKSVCTVLPAQLHGLVPMAQYAPLSNPLHGSP